MCRAVESSLKDKRRGDDVRNVGKEHSIPWRIKFLSCCIVDMLTDDVTRVFGSVDCREIGSVPIGVATSKRASTHSFTLSHTHTRFLFLSSPLSPSRVMLTGQV